MRNKKIQKDILSLLKKLVRIDTSYPPGNSDKFDRFIREYLKGSKLKISSYYDKDKKKLNTIVKNYRGNFTVSYTHLTLPTIE